MIRAATAGDLDEIARIQQQAPEAAAWNPASYLDYICRVTIIDDVVAGFLAARTVVPGEHEILNLAIAPAYRRRGLARSLIAGILRELAGEWFLEVRESNSAAIRLYSQAGFTLAGWRPGYYHDPSEAAIVMRILS